MRSSHRHHPIYKSRSSGPSYNCNPSCRKDKSESTTPYYSRPCSTSSYSQPEPECSTIVFENPIAVASAEKSTRTAISSARSTPRENILTKKKLKETTAKKAVPSSSRKARDISPKRNVPSNVSVPKKPLTPKRELHCSHYPRPRQVHTLSPTRLKARNVKNIHKRKSSESIDSIEKVNDTQNVSLSPMQIKLLPKEINTVTTETETKLVQSEGICLNEKSVEAFYVLHENYTCTPHKEVKDANTGQNYKKVICRSSGSNRPIPNYCKPCRPCQPTSPCRVKNRIIPIRFPPQENSRPCEYRMPCRLMDPLPRLPCVYRGPCMYAHPCYPRIYCHRSSCREPCRFCVPPCNSKNSCDPCPYSCGQKMPYEPPCVANKLRTKKSSKPKQQSNGQKKVANYQTINIEVNAEDKKKRKCSPVSSNKYDSITSLHCSHKVGLPDNQPHYCSGCRKKKVRKKKTSNSKPGCVVDLESYSTSPKRSSNKPCNSCKCKTDCSGSCPTMFCLPKIKIGPNPTCVELSSKACCPHIRIGS